MSSGFTGARVNQKDTKQKEFSTVNKEPNGCETEPNEATIRRVKKVGRLVEFLEC